MKPLSAVWGLVLSMSLHVLAGTRDAQWKRVEDAVGKGLPQTAIQELAPIIQGALADRAWAEAVKAIARKIALEGSIQGNQAEEKIQRLEAEIAKAPKEIVPMLDTILAHWYWQYFQQNRWRFLQRTATAQAPGNDLRTWDLPRLFDAIGAQFAKALAAGDQLKRIPIATYDELLPKGALPDPYRPTLYDFVAQEALTFYTSGEQAAAKPEAAFEVSAADPIFDPTEAFLRWNVAPVSTPQGPGASAGRSAAGKPSPGAAAASPIPPAVNAIRLYQALLQFHRDDADRTAFLDVDLARLVWANNVAFGEEKSARFQAALEQFAGKNGDHELAAMALQHWARALHGEGEFVKARDLALRARQIHPNSPGGKLAANLIAEIEAKSASVVAELVWNQPWPAIQVRYRNVDQVHFRLIGWDWDEFLDRRHSRPESLRDDERAQVLAKQADYAWSKDLPKATDFKEHRLDLPVPEDLKPGFYFLVASHQADFSEANNQLSMTDIWVSTLALVLRPQGRDLSGFVLNAESGEPIPGARVQAWYLDNQSQRVAIPDAVTDEQGTFAFKLTQQRGYVLKASAKGQQVAASEQISGWGQRPQARPLEQTLFFTDRALYRPGQTVQYKGICLRADQEKDTYETLAGRQVTVVFSDANRKEIARQSHRCNDYGSFSGSFTAPRDRLMGRMQLRAIVGPPGVAQVNVEEYKRPKFQVTLDAPKTGTKLNDVVQLTGHAMNYTGASVDDAQVSYRVVREVRMPWWWGWYGWRRGGLPHSESQEIAHGTVRTAADGTFKLEFTAQPDRSVPETDEPTFVFAVHADVTDSAGETRSGDRSVQLGYTALEARLSAEEWLTDDQPVQLRVRTTTLDGEPQVAEGVVKVHALQAPAKVQRPSLFGELPAEVDENTAGADGAGDGPSDPNRWELGPAVFEQGFNTDKAGNATLQAKLPAGAYRAVLETQDRYGKKVTGRIPLQVLRPADPRFAIKIPSFVGAPKWSVEPGQDFTGLWGTGYDAGRAFVEIEHRGQMLQRYWTKPGETQAQFKQAVSEAMRGGFAIHVTQVRENRGYFVTRTVEVPWSNQDLTLQWEHFTSKLQPGQKETWTLVVKGPKAAAGPVAATALPAAAAAAEARVAELVATLYDASLDAFLPHSWRNGFGVFRHEHSYRQVLFGNGIRPLTSFRQDWSIPQEPVDLRYREFPPELTQSLWGPVRMINALGGAARGELMSMRSATTRAAPAEAAPQALMMADSDMSLGVPATKGVAAAQYDPYFVQTGAEKAAAKTGPGATGPDLSQVAARKNLNETAFFFPQLLADANGTARLSFTMPEALTEWRFLGFAHDRGLRAGSLEARAVTAKDLMVQPNPPRFLREGDVIEFSVKVANQSDQPQRGKVRLTFNDAFTDKSADALLGNKAPELPFDLPAKASRSFAWRLTVPDGLAVLSYKAVAATDAVSDGEEGLLPVLARRVLVTESLPLPIVGPATNKFEFEELLKSGKSRTLQHQSLTVQMVSHPAWYAVMALPYLMEFPYECSEQVFNRFYANALARFVANSDPKIRRMFDLWKAMPTLDSPLEKNQDLKSVMIEESPWVRQAQQESEARKNVGVLFDENRLTSEQDRALAKLREAQMPDGAWSWFPGGRGNDYITLYIVTGFGRLRHLGVDLKVDLAVRSLPRLDRWLDQTYRDIKQQQTTQGASHLSPTVALYLYGRSFFLKDLPVAPEHKEALDYFLDQAKRYWTSVGQRQSQGHLAIALNRFGDVETARAILKSLKEHSVTSDELGRYWRDEEISWSWYHAPIETQALMIEAFDEVTQDRDAVEGCKVWLLKQKQTQDWKTTKATADAVYALLLRGRELLASDTLVEVDLGGVKITPRSAPAAESKKRNTEIRNPKSEIRTAAAEPGTGFYERRFAAAEVKSSMGRITVRKLDAGVAWGSVHWQYLEDMTQVRAFERTPLKLRKTLFTKRNTINGPVLEEVGAKQVVAVGDELVVRLELRVDRDMEYVHLKDQRGSGTEPVNVLSGYRYQDGLGYYESTRDTASHFFIDYLPKGTYVFEYSTRVQHRGEYQMGMATIQCMYAPEFNSHSESFKLTVK